MKKVLSIVMALGLFVGFSSCGDDGVGGTNRCNDAFVDYSNAVSAWAGDQNETTCQNLKDALLDLIDDCNVFDYLDQEDIDDINNLDCSVF